MAIEYSKKNQEAANNNKMQNSGMKWERSCTDILCCLIFLAFFVGMIGVSGYALSSGDPIKILTPFDSDGNQCGMPDQTASNTTDNVKRDFTDYPFKFFTGLSNIAEGSDALNNKALYFAVCVKECPSDVPLSKSADPTEVQECMVNDDVPECPTYASLFINTTAQYGYCMPDTDNASSAVK